MLRRSQNSPVAEHSSSDPTLAQVAPDRRRFLASLATAAAGCTLAGLPTYGWSKDKAKDPALKISLAEWSYHKALKAGQMDNLDFAAKARKEFDIEAVEYVNQFFKDKARDAGYLSEMKKRAADVGVKSLLIMIDAEGNLGEPDAAKRTQAVENHYRWVDAARELGCHSIRVNARSQGSYEEQQKLAADGLRRLSEYAASAGGLNVIVENHGGLSSNGEWLASVIKSVGLKNCGTLPDFGNFRLDGNKEYDRYQGVQELMPYAKAVSAKSYDFDDQGNETKIDYARMLKIVLDAGYRGYLGIEYEGSRLSETDGIRATQKLIQKVLAQLNA